jgi:branched-chain amino acid transport system substrate-binding protein
LVTGDAGAKARAAAAPLQLAAVVSLTGQFQAFGVQSQQSIQLAVKDINKSGGINGRQVKVQIFDDQSTPEGSASAAQRIGANKSFLGVTGGNTGVTGSPEAQVFNASQIPFVGTYGDATRGKPLEWVFKQSPTFSTHAVAILTFLHDVLKVKKVGVIYQTNGYGQAVAQTMGRSGKKYGVSAVTQGVPPTATNVTPALKKLIDQGVQAIVTAQSNNHSVTVRDLSTLSAKIPLVGDLGSSTPANLAAAGNLARGMPTLTYFNATAPLDRQKAFATLFENTYGDVPQVINASSWDGIQLLLRALKLAGKNPTRSSLRSALETAPKWAGVAGVYKFTKNNHQGATIDSFEWNTYLGNGKYRLNNEWLKATKA